MSNTLAAKSRFYHELYTGYKAGLPMDMLVLGAMNAVIKGDQGQALLVDIQQGKTLSSALTARKLISPWEAKLLNVGENSGRLEYILLDLATFYDDRFQQLRAIRARLLYPFIVLVFAIFVPPLPRLAAGTLDFGTYLFESTLKLLVLFGLYRFLFVLPFQRAGGAFNGVLLKLLNWLGPDRFLRELFEISYLNLLTMCLESGMDAAEALRMLKECSNNSRFRSRHQMAIRGVEKLGLSLTKALSSSGIIQNSRTIAFLNTSEHTGTLHSDLRQYVRRKKGEVSNNLNHLVKKYSNWLYVLLIVWVGSNIA